MADIAQNGRAPEELEEVDFRLKNLDNDGLGEDVSDIEADDDDEDDDLFEDDMENPLTIRKSEGDEDDKDDDDDDDVEKSDGDDSDSDDDDDEDALKKQAKKGGLTVGNLNKSIRQLASFVEQQDPQTRKQSLLRRAQLGKSLSKSEQTELMSFFAEASEEAPRQKRLSKGLSQNRAIQRGIDQSEFLANQHVELCKALGDVEASVSQVSRSGAEFNLMLAKAVAGIGQELKRLSKSLDGVLSAPAQGPKSVGVSGRARPLAKSQAATAEKISYAEASQAIQGLLAKSMEQGRYGRSASGADLLKGSMHLESCGSVHPEIQADVQRYLRETR